MPVQAGLETAMGREAVCVAQWRGAVEEVKALLESQEIILRGAIKARVARARISAISVEGDELVLTCDGERLVLDLGPAEADKWRIAVLKPLPTLASKLGVGPDRRAFVIGSSEDRALNEALQGAVCTLPGDAALFLALIGSNPDLPAAVALADQHPGRPVWCIYGKGKTAMPGDSDVRTFMRARGYADSKSCAVSEALTATRYARTQPDCR
jgi:hypothetical protein